MKNATPPVELEPTAFVAMSPAHRTIHLRHGEWSTWQKFAGIDSYVIELLAMCYYLQTTHKPNTCSLLKGCGFESRCGQFFFI